MFGINTQHVHEGDSRDRLFRVFQEMDKRHEDHVDLKEFIDYVLAHYRNGPSKKKGRKQQGNVAVRALRSSKKVLAITDAPHASNCSSNEARRRTSSKAKISERVRKLKFSKLPPPGKIEQGDHDSAGKAAKGRASTPMIGLTKND
jgi:hypothetical protein